jgi:hypothetical protein
LNDGSAIHDDHGIDHGLGDALDEKITFLIFGEVEDLACGLKALNEIVIAEASGFKRNDFIHSDETIAVDIGGGGGTRLVRSDGRFFRFARSFLLAVRAHNFVFVMSDHVTASGAHGTANDRTERVVLGYRRSDGGATGSAHNSTLLTGTAGHIAATNESKDERSCQYLCANFVCLHKKLPNKPVARDGLLSTTQGIGVWWIFGSTRNPKLEAMI